MSGLLHVRLQSAEPVRLDAEFDCAPGELVALVGASGSGKTTLLRSVAGLHRSVDMAGTVRLGESVWMDSAQGIDLPAQQRRAGLVFQQYALFPHLNAIDNIAIIARQTCGNSHFEAKKIAWHWLERLGLSELGKRLPHQLSGGQQQRVALARALVRIQGGQGSHNANTPGVLLLDEPFSAVDAPMRQVLYRELAQLRQGLNVPIVLVTHDLMEARRLADRMVIIDAGQSLQSGPPAQVIRSPRNARVAALVGIHNHFHAQFNSTGGQLAWLDWGELRLRVRDKGKIESGTSVTWVLAGEAVQVLQRDQVPDPQANRLLCTLSEMLPLGEISLCRLAVHGTPDTIQLNLPTAQLAAMGASTGNEIRLSVPMDAAHIMPLRV
jgi:molybdate transport system ATP-binding protein